MNIKELKEYIESVETNWVDDEYLGKFEDQDICIFNRGVNNKVIVEFDPLFGLIFLEK